jgi:F0F1-type ATP synthase assembly protein I
MLGNMICWVIALGIMLSKTTNTEDLYLRTLLAMGFIFLGILSKAVDVDRETHSNTKNQGA